MNHYPELTTQKENPYTSVLVNLFQQKGYKCEEIAQEGETIYVMKFDLPQAEKSFEPRPRILVHWFPVWFSSWISHGLVRPQDSQFLQYNAMLFLVHSFNADDHYFL